MSDLFKRASGEMRAVSVELDGILEATRQFVDRINSDPPPMLLKNKDPKAGLYSWVDTEKKDK